MAKKTKTKTTKKVNKMSEEDKKFAEWLENASEKELMKIMGDTDKFLGVKF